jgi:predicted ATPase
MRKLLEVRVLESLQDFKPHLAIEMDELSRSEVDDIVCSLVEKGNGDTVSKDVLDAIVRNSGGMPNAIAGVMELVTGNGGSIFLDPAKNQWRWKPDTKNGEAVLHAARAAFITRIDNLTVETKDILKIAAITCDAKHKFKLHDLKRVIEADLATKSRYVKASHAGGISEPRLAYHLQPAVLLGLVKYSRGFVSSTEDWAFASSAIAEAVLEMIPLERQNEIGAIAQDLNIQHSKSDAVSGLQKEFLGAA